MTAILTLCEAGDHIVSASTLYGGTYTLLEVNLRKLGIETTFVQPDDPENFRRAIKKNTKILYAETLGNPLINIVDIEAIGKIAREAGIPLVIDNTVPSPYLCRPFEWGADIVVHSATKYIGGHGTTMGGIIVESGKFPWDNGKFPGMTEPSRGYHGVRFYETFGDFGYTMRARMETLRTFGPALRERARGREVPPGPSAGGVGQLSGAPRQQVRHARAEISSEGRKWPSQFWRQGRGEGGRKIHRGRKLHEPSRQYRRREDPHHSSRLDHAPADVRGGTGQGGRHPRHDPHLRRFGDA